MFRTTYHFRNQIIFNCSKIDFDNMNNATVELNFELISISSDLKPDKRLFQQFQTCGVPTQILIRLW